MNKQLDSKEAEAKPELYTLLCSRADLLTTNVDLKHKRKTKRILAWILLF
jgi:hypothetical protein